MHTPESPRDPGWFYCTRFRLKNALSPQKVSTDGVLLGAWAGQGMESRRVLRIADLGAGTGILGALLADRFPKAQIDLFEWHSAACADLRESLDQWPFSERLDLIEGDWFEQLPMYRPKGGYDLVVTNPPFWVDQRPSIRSDRAQARHMDSEADWIRWLRSAAEAVAPGGRLCWVASAEPIAGEIDALPTELRLLRRVWIRAKPQKPRIRRLEEWIRPRSVVSSDTDLGPVVEQEWTLYEANGTPGNDYKKLLRDFLPSLSSQESEPPPINPNCSK